MPAECSTGDSTAPAPGASTRTAAADLHIAPHPTESTFPDTIRHGAAQAHEHRKQGTRTSAEPEAAEVPDSSLRVPPHEAPAAEPGCMSDSSSAVVYGSLADPSHPRPSAHAQIWVAADTGLGKAMLEEQDCYQLASLQQQGSQKSLHPPNPGDSANRGGHEDASADRHVDRDAAEDSQPLSVPAELQVRIWSRGVTMRWTTKIGLILLACPSGCWQVGILGHVQPGPCPSAC